MMKLMKLAVVLAVALAMAPGITQGGGSDVTELLLAKARALDARGRGDLAAQTWKQVIVVDANNVEALSGLARFAQQSGRAEEAKRYLNQLRKIQPQAAEATSHSATGYGAVSSDPRLPGAERLAQSGKYEEAIRLYQEVFGKQPPPGAWTIAYYETMAGVKGRSDEATAALAALVKANPGALDYRLSLGKLYTYQPHTRIQGMRILEAIPDSSIFAGRARQAWRQALIWDAGSRSSAPVLRAYLAAHPDAELEKLLAKASSVAPVKLPIQSASEKIGYDALNAGDPARAAEEFEKAIRETPKSATAVAGLAYARMKQQDWAAAVKAWEKAIELAPGNKKYLEERSGARFFLAMKEGTQALEAGRAPLARQRFETALAIRPDSTDAQRGLAGALTTTGDYKGSAALFEKFLSGDSKTPANWKNLVSSRIQAGQARDAMALWEKAPEEVRAALRTDVPFQLLLASAWLGLGDTKRAVEVYQLAATEEPLNLIAWEGWIGAELTRHEEAKAYELLSNMPREVYLKALARPGFLRSAAVIQIKFGRLDAAEALLTQWITQDGADNVPPGVQAQLAEIWLKQGKLDLAEKLLRDLQLRSPNDPDVWRLFLSVLQQQRRPAEALVESKRIPAMAQVQLQSDPGYLSLMANLNSDAGNQGEALKMIRETLERFAQKGTQPPGDLLLQQAWLLLNTAGDDRELFSILRRLSPRKDMTVEQQKSYQDLWSVWAQRRAEEARRAGDLPRATAILQEAMKLLPSDGKIRSAYAGYLMQAGDTKTALAAYKTWGLIDATPADYSSAVGSAMAEKSDLAGRWLQEGMKKYPADPQLLSLAGQMAAQKGDYRRAEIYYRSALALTGTKSKQETAPLLANREPGNSLGRLLVGETPKESDSERDANRLGRVLSGAAPADSPELSGKDSIFGSDFVNKTKKPRAESEEISDRLQSITARNASFFDVTSNVQSRSGTAGFDRRTLSETEISVSKVMGDSMRMSLVARPTVIQTAASDGSSQTFQLGLLPVGSTFNGQSVSGLGADFQLSSDTFGLRLGAGPQGFLVKNYFGALRFKPADGPITILLSRDGVKDSLLSYAGVQDTISKQVWGGVVSNHGQIIGNWGTEKSGFYLSGGYALITGQNVESNRSFDGNGGAYWRVLQRGEESLTMGLNLTGLSYEKNLRYYTLGHGGYFSPQRFYIFNVPVTWKGIYSRRLHYTASASLGTQHFREDDAPYYPRLASLQQATGFYYTGQSQTGASYTVDFKGFYQLAEQWFLGGFLNVNNARNYNSQAAGFSLKYSFKPKPIGSNYEQSTVPDWKGAQPFRP